MSQLRGAPASLAVEPAHGLWQLSRAALPVDVFRTIAGLLLIVHFLTGARERIPLLERGFLADAVAHSALMGLPWWSWRALFGSAVLLAVCVALGVAACWSASLLLVLSTVLGGALFPLHHLDDWVASVSCFWLMLLPVGRSWPARLTRRRVRVPEERVPGLVVSLLLLHVLAFYPCVKLWALLSPLWKTRPLATLSACLVPALYLLPLLSARRAAAVLQLGLHGYLALVAGEPLSHGILMATGLLFWGERGSSPHLKGAVLDLRGAIAICYSVLLLLWAFSLQTARTELTSNVGRVLEDLGLHPPLVPAQLRGVTLAFVAEDGSSVPWAAVPGMPDEARLSTQQLITRMAIAALSQADVARELARSDLVAAAELYCGGKPPSERPVLITLEAPDLGTGRPYPVVSFHCYDPADSLLWLHPSSNAASRPLAREKTHEGATP